MNKKSIFLTSLFPDELITEITKRSIGPIANANNELQWSLYNGLKEFYPDLYLVNQPNIGSFPKRYNSLRMKGSIIKKNNNEIGESLSFINLPYLKHYVKFTKVLNYMESLINKNKKIKNYNFFVYDLYLPFIKTIFILKNKYKDLNIHTCLIVPDLIGMTGTDNNFMNNFLINRERNNLYSHLDSVDSFIFLSEHMKDMLPCKDAPYRVIEGIFDISKIDAEKDLVNDINLLNDIKNKMNLKLFYSGALDERNGVLNLLEAFSLIDDSRYRLIICGDGPLKSNVQYQAYKDNRIIYLGQIPHKQVLNMQHHMDLLINPRLPGQIFTKFSFPSKTMEYFVSGVPTLMYRLEGVPEDYFKYCFTIDNVSEISNPLVLKEKIIEIFSLPFSIRNNKSKEAKKYIIENKNPYVQCKKIYELVEASCKK